MLKKLIPKNVWNKITLPFHLATALAGNIIYGWPGSKIKVIGITGTNGKSTSAIMLARILESAGYKVGVSSTVLFKIADTEWMNDTNKTTLGRFGVFKLLNKMVKADCDFAVIEVTSHALVQHRVWGIAFDIAAFTNLAPEHLDYHQSMEEYRAAKGKLFSMLNSKKKGISKTAVINCDDPEFGFYAKFPAERKISFGLKPGMDIKESFVAAELHPSLNGTEFTLMAPDGESKIRLPMLGKFNVYNALCAAACAYAAGVTSATSALALNKIQKIPGRLEEVGEELPFKIIVDYAHTPDAFSALYTTLRDASPNGRLFAVFGATGDRDRRKRPALGRIASELADIVILTNEEPYTEDPDIIIAEVEAGIPDERKKKDFYIVKDRASAIKKAISLARPNDVIAVTGMGHQKYAVYGTKKIPWSDREIIQKILAEKISI